VVAGGEEEDIYVYFLCFSFSFRCLFSKGFFRLFYYLFLRDILLSSSFSSSFDVIFVLIASLHYTVFI